MSEVELEILRAAAQLGVLSSRVSQCGAAEAAQIVAKAKGVFVDGNPRVWWLALKRPYKTYPYEADGHVLLLSHVPADEERCWLIPESDEDELPVFDCEISALSPLLANCFFFEYYVLGKGFDWLVADTDHDELVVCR